MKSWRGAPGTPLPHSQPPQRLADRVQQDLWLGRHALTQRRRKRPVHAAASASTEIKRKARLSGSPAQTAPLALHASSSHLQSSLSLPTGAHALAAPRSCFLPASLPSAERPPTRDEGGGEASPDGAARCL